ncbi:glycoside hydrolase family 99-like domain-containing protein [Lacrimispora xylanolytica]|uniref:Glycoside hydrolase family 99-like domain-containing protein n=1 Tax=Lacrimispora xylanolytica TaxID=29375 RepID=A0ABY7ACV1_9FIRM|nr:glycoside hydrolase family 99-like domain-containing protein [Lacrimispora xylanolytica]WAJ24098.1 glycoside hydrolase family 99-like domain-containing protein [Lacrimispora xylanolytica]
MKDIKTIAMYLPQFHNIPENDQWWGEGFTEWTAAKRADKLFEGHYQPREPLNNNYYNLLQKRTMEWQAGLASKYGLDGFCFYHYYFKDGRKVLEKPAELLLSWCDVNMPFCFCWDNTSWARSWSKLGNKFTWFEKEKEHSCEGDGILLEQKYGREKEWEDHFKYLLPFFKDDRYIKVDKKPLFIIYKTDEMACFTEMIDYWKKLALDEEIEGIYTLGINSSNEKRGMDGVLYSGPGAYWNPIISSNNLDFEYKNGVKCFDYESIWKNALIAKGKSNLKTYFGGFVDYDDTPRRGDRGAAFINTSVEVFEKYLYKLAQKNLLIKNEFLFINAFNEWGEGMYLEPDKKRGYAFLEALRSVKEKLRNSADDEKLEFTSVLNVDKRPSGDREKISADMWKQNNKFKEYYYLLHRWLQLKEENVNLSKYLIKCGYCNIAIYGLGVMGKHLLEELRHTEIQVLYAIDQNELMVHPDIEIKSVNDFFPQVDAVVVTATFDYDVIRTMLKEKIDYPIVSLAELLYEV